MGEPSVSQVAAVVLSESGPEAPAFRREANRPLEGYGMVSGGAPTCEVTLFLKNARMPAVYHGWTVGTGDPTYLGPFHMGSGGEGSLSVQMACGALETTSAFLVTAGNVILSGALVWLVRSAAPDGGAPATEQPPDPEPGQMGESAPAPGTEASVEPSPEAKAMAEPEPLTAPGPEAQAEPEPEPEPEIPSAPEPEPITPGFKLYYEPARPVISRVSLNSAHPQASRGGGVAVVDSKRGALTLSLRGLPSPSRLGADPSTGRSFNAYRAWLQHRQTRSRHPVGLCERTWGDNFSLEVQSGLQLSEYDLIIITAGDRAAAAPDPQAPAVLTGTL